MKKKWSAIFWGGLLTLVFTCFISCDSDEKKSIFDGSTTFMGDMHATMIIPLEHDTVSLSDTLGYTVRINKDMSVQFSHIQDTLRYHDILYKAKVILSARNFKMAATSIDTLRTLSFEGEVELFLDNKLIYSYPVNEVTGKIGSTYMEFRSMNISSSQNGNDEPYAWLRYTAKKMY